MNLDHQGQALVRNLPQTGKELPVHKEQADQERKQLVHNLHSSITANTEKSDSIESGYGVDPRGNVPKEGVNTTAGVSLCQERSTTLLGRSKLCQNILDNFSGESADTEHLFHQPRRTRGAKVNHDGHAEGICWPEGPPAPTRHVIG